MPCPFLRVQKYWTEGRREVCRESKGAGSSCRLFIASKELATWLFAASFICGSGSCRLHRLGFLESVRGVEGCLWLCTEGDLVTSLVGDIGVGTTLFMVCS